MVYPIPLAFGVAQFATNALGAFGQQQQAEEEYRYSEKQRKLQDRYAQADYQRRVQQSQNDWNQAIRIRKAEIQQYQSQLEENNIAANRAMYANNKRLSEIQDRYKSQALDSYLQVLEMNAQGAASGGTGRRAGMAQRANVAALGRQMSLRGDALVRQQEDTMLANQEVQNNRRIRDRNAYFPVSIPMQKPMAPAPPMRSIAAPRPSRMGMYTSMISGAMGAISTMDQMNPGGIFGMQQPIQKMEITNLGR